MPRRPVPLLLAVVFLAFAAPAEAVDLGDRTALQTTVAIAQGANPSISGDERYDRVLAFDKDGTVYIARNATPTVNAAYPWSTDSVTPIGTGHNPDVDGQPGEPPVPPKCVAYLSPTNQPMLKHLGGGTERLSDHPVTNVSVNGTCTAVAFGDRQGLNLVDVASDKTTVVKTNHPVESVDFASRSSSAQARVAYETHDVSYVYDARDKSSRRMGAGQLPVISEQAHVVAFERRGSVFINGTWQDGFGPVRNVTIAGVVANGGPSIGAGGSYVAWEGSGLAWLWTDVRDLSLLESLDANKKPLSPVSDVEISSRGNEVFFVYNGTIMARYLGPK